VRIGVLPGSPSKGGVYQYSLAVLDALDPAVAAAEGDELVLLSDADSGLDLAAFAAAGWRVAEPPGPDGPGAAPGVAARARLRLGLMRAKLRGRSAAEGPPGDPTAIRRRPDLAAWHAELGIDLMVYPNPTTVSFEAGTPYVTAVHDLQHRLQPEFPEVSANGEAEWREYLYRNAIAGATLVLAESEVGREDILQLYGDVADPERIKVLSHIPPPYVLGGRPGDGAVAEVRARYGLPERYLYYPAQFWPHKNHALIVRALALPEARDLVVVFSGGHGGVMRGGTHAEVLRLAEELGVADRVHDLGYVANEEIAPLYAGAVALVMPTFFGPTNLPALEAWALDCAVISSDIRGIREQIGDAGLVVDPRSAEALADAMVRVWTDDELRRRLVERGRARTAAYSAAEFGALLNAYLREAKALLAAAR
jgi:glycosyltransferase involved in cell wall biosynthesis